MKGTEEVGKEQVGKTVELLDREARAPQASARAQRLKDKVYLKEMRAAITSGEFAEQLRGPEKSGAIDYQGLCSRFEAFAWKLRFQPLDTSVLPEEEAAKIMQTLESMSSRLEDLSHEDFSSQSQHDAASPNGAMGSAGVAAAPAEAATAEAEPPKPAVDPRRIFYLREDMAVDLDGALSEANKAARFSRDLWERLKGGGSEHEGSSEESKKVVVPQTPAVQEKQERCDKAQSLLTAAEEDLAQLLARAADPQTLGRRSSELRRELRMAEQLVRERKGFNLLASIDLILECAATVLDADLERTSVAEWEKVSGQLKLSVVEFALLDTQAAYYQQFVPEDFEASISESAPHFIGVLDPDELAVLESDCAEFATGIGIEEADTSERSLFTEAQRLVSQVERNLEKVKAGFTFYTLGGQLLWQDLQYATSLFSKAALYDYSLNPREVRALQRTAKDVVTFVPFLIILIIPMTPIGHVLVFSFIQKFFPDFFPSTFTERRQNVVKIYRDIVPEGGTSRRT